MLWLYTSKTKIMIGEPKFGEWNNQNTNETEDVKTPNDSRLSEEEAFEEASRMKSLIERSEDGMDYNEAEKVAEAEKREREQLTNRIVMMSTAFQNSPMKLAEGMRNVSPEFIRDLARAFKGESYVTIFGSIDPDNMDSSEVQMRLWSDQPDLGHDGRADWGSNNTVAIAASSAQLFKALDILRSLKAEEIAQSETGKAHRGRKSGLYKVDTSNLSGPQDPYYE